MCSQLNIYLCEIAESIANSGSDSETKIEKKAVPKRLKQIQKINFFYCISFIYLNNLFLRINFLTDYIQICSEQNIRGNTCQSNAMHHIHIQLEKCAPCHLC